MAALKIDEPAASPLPCAVHNETGGCREVTIGSSVGPLVVVLCPTCYGEAQQSGQFRGQEILAWQEFVLIDSADPAYQAWLGAQPGTHQSNTL